MKRAVVFAVVAFVGIDAGLVGAVLAPKIHLPWTEQRGAEPQNAIKNLRQQPPKSVESANQEHMSPEEQMDFDKRQAEAVRIIGAAQDKFLTGDPNGHAEWQAYKNDSAMCGVTPTGRYIIVRNEIGQTRYDEPAAHQTTSFGRMWAQIDCETTAPIHQAELLERAAQERLYRATHTLDPDCVTRELKLFGANPQAEAERQRAHPHECYQPRSVWEVGMPDPDSKSASVQADAQ